jgi:cytosine/adenosine deaminase-related metal-dependent hydrolase
MGILDRLRPLAFVNARVIGAEGLIAASLRVEHGRIAALDAAPRSRNVVVDLSGALVLPGLVNAHEHLEHNHFGRVKYRAVYGSAAEWVADLRPRLQTDPALLAGKARPLSERLLVGGIKNLLSGATTVAHHNPFYRELQGEFPVRVVRRYGWAHSLYLQNGRAGANGESAGDVAERYRATPAGWPFVIHLAEGVDEAARAELDQLERLGGLGANTVLVHGVGLGRAGWRRVAERGAGGVWCPASNLFLLGQTLDLRSLQDAGGLTRLALGTDSRLTGARDLLDELRVAASVASVVPAELFGMVTTRAADLLRLPQAGRLAPGFPADLLVLPPLAPDPYQALLAAERKDVLLVMVGGRPRYGAPGLQEVFAARGVKPSLVTVDGATKLLDGALARRLAKCSLAEPGLAVPA